MVKLQCVLSAAGNDNANGNDDNIIFTITDSKLYVLIVTLSTIGNQRLTKLLTKRLKDHFNKINMKEKVKLKIRQISIDIFSNQILLELIDCLF